MFGLLVAASSKKPSSSSQPVPTVVTAKKKQKKGCICENCSLIYSWAALYLCWRVIVGMIHITAAVCWLAGDKQPTDNGNYVGKFSLLNQSDSGDDDDDDDEEAGRRDAVNHHHNDNVAEVRVICLSCCTSHAIDVSQWYWHFTVMALTCRVTMIMQRCDGIFITWQHIMLSVQSYMLSPVRLSIHPSHRWISWKRFKLGLCNFHHTLAQYL